ncbi:MAG: GHKL domain-containing protein [Candidatus Omnitrophica bacterium]|nr:GHKL domain-containing protein [Candidatus Omnitrophota bacterium]
MNLLTFLLFLSLVVFFIIYGFMMNRHWQKMVKEKSELVKETEAQLIQMEKMASLGTLAAGIAHEINNPLGFLISNLETMHDYAGDIEKGRGDAVKIKELDEITKESLEGAQRIKKIVQDLRTFSRKSELQHVSVDINQILESTLSIVWNEIKYKVDVIKDYQAKTNIYSDPTELSQVFLNLLINASQAIGDKGSITLSTWQNDEDIFIRVSDTGCGISQEVLPKIFDPFFTTNKKGTGLGLSVSYNIVKKYNGDIRVQSTVGEGTSFTVRLPKELSEEDKRA